MDFTTFPIFKKYFTLDQFRNQTLAILKEWTQDSRLLFDLDVYTILAEINDLYATSMLSKAIPQALPLESRFSLLTYYMYLVNLTVGSTTHPSAPNLEMFAKTLSASIYYEAGVQTYELRWEPDEIITLLLTGLNQSDKYVKQELDVLNCSPPFRSTIWNSYCLLKDALALAKCRTESDYLNCDLSFKGILREQAIEMAKDLPLKWE